MINTVYLIFVYLSVNEIQVSSFLTNRPRSHLPAGNEVFAIPSCPLLFPPVPSCPLLFPPIPSCVTCYLPPLLCRPPWQSLHLSQTEDRQRNTTVRSDSPSAQDTHSTSGYLSQSRTYIIPRPEAFVLYHMIYFF